MTTSVLLFYLVATLVITYIVYSDEGVLSRDPPRGVRPASCGGCMGRWLRLESRPPPRHKDCSPRPSGISLDAKTRLSNLSAFIRRHLQVTSTAYLTALHSCIIDGYAALGTGTDEPSPIGPVLSVRMRTRYLLRMASFLLASTIFL